jgi:hypothetical protein
MTDKLLYSVIYGCDVQRNVKLVAPTKDQIHLWQCTERNGGPNGEQMGWGQSDEWGNWKRGRHRKYCAILDQEQFDAFILHADLHASGVETCGSLGAPGLGFGVSPAIAFEKFEDDCFQQAYVTPFPDTPPPDLEIEPALPGFEDVLLDVVESEMQSLWEEIKTQIVTTYGTY